MASPSFAEEVAALYEEEAPKMRSHARRHLPDPHDTEDAVNEAFADLSALGSLSGIRNPRGWLMTTLNRVILEALRRKYRHQRHVIKAMFAAETTSSDLADDYERTERDLLVRKSVDALDPDESRILNLYSEGYKPSEIALMESARGSPATSRDVTVALYEAWPRLAKQFRKRGVLPTAVPLAWLLPEWRIRMRSVATRLGEFLRLLEPAAAVSVIAIMSLLPPNHADKSHGLASRDRGHSAPAFGIDHGPDLTAALLQDIRSGPSKEGSKKTPDSPMAGVDLADEHSRLDHWDDYEDRPPPSLTDQLLGIIEDPGKIPTPECRGLSICP